MLLKTIVFLPLLFFFFRTRSQIFPTDRDPDPPKPSTSYKIPKVKSKTTSEGTPGTRSVVYVNDLRKADINFESKSYVNASTIYLMYTDKLDSVQCFRLGWMYENGYGVPLDNTKAMWWFQKAAEKRVTSAMYFIGNMYYYGKGVPQDYAEAMKWFRRAADKGNSSAMTSIGIMYYLGYGVQQDYAGAMQWFRKAADRGVTPAMYFIGTLYENGNKGVNKSISEAVKWYKKAAHGGDSNAKDALKRLRIK